MFFVCDTERRKTTMNNPTATAGVFVWIVDDDPIYTAIMQATLQKTNVIGQTAAFNHAWEALEALGEKADDPDALPDLLLLDINMSVMDGWGFLEQFALCKPNLAKQPLLCLVTSSIDLGDMRKARMYPDVSEYLVKPVSVDKMRALAQQAGGLSLSGSAA
jgi:CheY-like chemotaxis protein